MCPPPPPPNDTKLQGQTFQIKAGTLILKENEVSRKMYLIRKGKVRVFKKYLNQRITLAILGDGEVFGELAFFDAQPRSASIEALTDCTIVVLDGEQAVNELPNWIMPLLRSAFHRFREADQKITVLQSINEFQKRNFKNDTVAKTVYMELLRFNKALKLLYTRDQQAFGEVKAETLLQELDDVLGNRYIGLKVYWKLLKEYDFIDHQLEESAGKAKLNLDALEAWNAYLNSEAQNERFMLVNHSTLALLRRILGHVQGQSLEGADSSENPVLTPPPDGAATEESIRVPLDELKLKSLPLAQEAIQEIQKLSILPMDGSEAFLVVPEQLSRFYTFQSILKAFDHTIVNLD